MVIKIRPFNIPYCKKCGWEGSGYSPSSPGEIDYKPEKCPKCGEKLEEINCIRGGPEFEDSYKVY